MMTQIWKFLLLGVLLAPLATHARTGTILIEREVKWSHPVLDVLKKHGISLHKIRYSTDGTCPVFYVDFKTSPEIHDFTTAYGEILKANSNFPYGLVDKKDKLMIDVGWSDDVPSRMNVQVGKLFHFNYCSVGSRTMSFKFKMNANLKKNILSSPFKALMRRPDGKELVAYLYAEDGVSEAREYYTPDGDTKPTIATQGSFYIYLYDPQSDTFVPNKIAPFYESQGFSINQSGSDFFVLPHNKENESDILIIGVFVNSNGNEYEAYGFSKDLSTLIKYRFSRKNEKLVSFYGKMFAEKTGGYAYNKHENITEDEEIRGKIEQFKLHVSDIAGEIKVDAYVPEEAIKKQA